MLKEGQVLTLPKGLFVRRDKGDERVSGLSEDTRVMVLASWKAAPGTEDDHFTECELAAVIEFDGKWDPAKTRMVIATAGDFNDRYILKDAESLVEGQVYKRTYVEA